MGRSKPDPVRTDPSIPGWVYQRRSTSKSLARLAAGLPTQIGHGVLLDPGTGVAWWCDGVACARVLKGSAIVSYTASECSGSWSTWDVVGRLAYGSSENRWGHRRCVVYARVPLVPGNGLDTGRQGDLASSMDGHCLSVLRAAFPNGTMAGLARKKSMAHWLLWWSESRDKALKLLGPNVPFYANEELASAVAQAHLLVK